MKSTAANIPEWAKKAAKHIVSSRYENTIREEQRTAAIITMHAPEISPAHQQAVNERASLIQQNALLLEQLDGAKRALREAQANLEGARRVNSKLTQERSRSDDAIATLKADLSREVSLNDDMAKRLTKYAGISDVKEWTMRTLQTHTLLNEKEREECAMQILYGISESMRANSKQQ